jgi:hypothetical protein
MNTIHGHLRSLDEYDFAWSRSKIRLIEDNAKCRHLKNDLKRDFPAGVYLSEAQKPYPPTLQTVYVYSIHIHTGKGRIELQRRLEGQ